MAFLRHLALRCADMERSRKFYEDVIGWRFVGYRPSGDAVDLSDGTLNMTLIQQPGELVENRPDLQEGTEYIHFGVIVDDLDGIWQRLHEWGAEFSRENVKERNPIDPSIRPPQSFKVLDPDGNVVDITNSRDEWNGVTV